MSADPPVYGPEEEQLPPAPMLGPVPMEPVPPPQRRGRAGRDLVAAVSVGVGLAAMIVVSLFLGKAAFVAVVALAAVLGVLELANALATAHLRVPLVPLLLGAVGLPIAAYVGGTEPLTLALSAMALGVVGVRLLHGRSAGEAAGANDPGAVGDIMAGLFTALYLPFLASFAVLLLRPDDGTGRVLAFVLLTVLSDIGGYAAGVLFGRHAMAGSISPKKSWEGFIGSAVFSATGGAIVVSYLTWGTPLQGALIGLTLMLAATLGDLGESMIKRDIGVKDMGHLLPGHGGVMDRLDSLLPAAPVAYLLLGWIAPT